MLVWRGLGGEELVEEGIWSVCDVVDMLGCARRSRSGRLKIASGRLKMLPGRRTQRIRALRCCLCWRIEPRLCAADRSRECDGM